MIRNGFVQESWGSWISLDLIKCFDYSFTAGEKVKGSYGIVVRLKTEDDELADEIYIEDQFRSMEDAKIYLNEMLSSSLKTVQYKFCKYGFACIGFDDDHDLWTWVDIRMIEKKYFD